MPTCSCNAAFTARRKRTCFSSAVASCESRLRDLTFAMSGEPKGAKRPLERPRMEKIGLALDRVAARRKAGKDMQRAAIQMQVKRGTRATDLGGMDVLFVGWWHDALARPPHPAAC